MLELFESDSPTQIDTDLIAAKEICKSRLTPASLDLLTMSLMGMSADEIAADIGGIPDEITKELADIFEKIRS